MLKRFALWFICFGLSFLVSDVFGWTDREKAFFYIYTGAGILWALGLTAICIIVNLAEVILIPISTAAGTLAIELFATLVVTKLVGVDFFVAYQIIIFGQCLCTDSKKKDD